jgi:hypothetical protein
MFTKQSVQIGLAVILALIIALSAYAAPAPKLWPEPLAQIIEGAKKGGTVSVCLPSRIMIESIERLRKEIREKFGVDLNIKFAPSSSAPKIRAGGFYGANQIGPFVFPFVFFGFLCGLVILAYKKEKSDIQRT